MVVEIDENYVIVVIYFGLYKYFFYLSINY